MRTIVTGTVGIDKGKYLEKVRSLALAGGHEVELCHIGQLMYAEAPDVAPGRILDLPVSRLSTLRRSVFKDVLALAQRTEHILVNTHATFRWKHGLFPAFDFDQLAQFDADMYICLVDNVDAVHARLLQGHHIDHSLKDLMVWREEELLATELMMLGCSLQRQGGSKTSPSGGKNNPAKKPSFYILANGENYATAEMFYRLMFHNETAKAYLSFPITHIMGQKTIVGEIEQFRRLFARQFIVFDPMDLEEYQLYLDALQASQAGHKVVEKQVLGQAIRFDVAEIMQAAGDIHSQIYARDFRLIDQSDMIISYIPELPDGKPGLSSGVERELQHAHEATKEVYVIWRPQAKPSPFVTETATAVFRSIDEAMEHLQGCKYIKTLPRVSRSGGELFPA